MTDIPHLIFILHNLRSAHNVGSLFRSADGIGVEKIYCVGYTPVPALPERKYLSVAEKEIRKTALGAETWIPWESRKSLPTLIRRLKKEGIQIVALELSEGSVDYMTFEPHGSVALILGNEIDGVPKNICDLADAVVSIPMQGKKESLNVSVAGAVAGFAIRGKMKMAGYICE